MARQTSIRDVARAAGVSRSTVSLVLNNSPTPSNTTREKVLQAINALNYNPDPVFRQVMRHRHTGVMRGELKTRTVGFLTAEAIFQGAEQQDGYYSRVVTGIHQALTEKRYHLMWETLKPETMALPAMVADGRVDGLLIESEIPVLLRELLVKRLPVTFIDRTYPGLPANAVIPNTEQGVREILDYLWELGHRNIVTFAQAAPSSQAEVYARTFRAWFGEKGEAVRQPQACRPREINPHTHNQVLAAYAQELAALPARPTALMTWDVYACTLVTELQKVGLGVPADISVVGMDDWIGARLCTPQLTTYRFPMDELGRSATELLIEQINNRDRPVRQVLVNGQLVERASCAQPTN